MILKLLSGVSFSSRLCNLNLLGPFLLFLCAVRSSITLFLDFWIMYWPYFGRIQCGSDWPFLEEEIWKAMTIFWKKTIWNGLNIFGRRDMDVIILLWETYLHFGFNAFAISVELSYFTFQVRVNGLEIIIWGFIFGQTLQFE